MSRFYVGQRVRIVKCIFKPEYVGQETTVVRGLHISRHPVTGELFECYDVAIDPEFGPKPGYLEPLTDSYDKISWSECIWRPSHEMA